MRGFTPSARFAFLERPHFDPSQACPWHLRGDPDGVVQVPGVDQVKPTQSLLRPDDGAIGDEQRAVADADRRGRSQRAAIWLRRRSGRSSEAPRGSRDPRPRWPRTRAQARRRPSPPPRRPGIGTSRSSSPPRRDEPALTPDRRLEDPEIDIPACRANSPCQSPASQTAAKPGSVKNRVSLRCRDDALSAAQPGRSSSGKPVISITGRISTVPQRTPGMRAAMSIASSRSEASIR